VSPPASMKQIFTTAPAGADVVRVGEATVPTPGAGQVLIEGRRGGHQPARPLPARWALPPRPKARVRSPAWRCRAVSPPSERASRT